MKKENGITLISLVITIIVLLILAMISIGMLIGENGILSQAEKASEETIKGQAEEKIKLIINEWNIEKYALNNEELGMFLNSKVPLNLDEALDNGDGTYTVIVDGYQGRLDSDAKLLGEITLAGLTVSNLNITNGDGVEIVIGEIVRGTTITIDFGLKDKGEEIPFKIISPVGVTLPYTIKDTEFVGKLEFVLEAQIDGSTRNLTKVIDLSEIAYESPKEINEPVLVDGMVGVYWEGTTEVIVNENNKDNWYAYYGSADSDMSDGGTTNLGYSKWANAKTSDGNYWVWIPRYEYKIEYVDTENKTEGGNIDINFISVDKTIPTEGYIIHPAFQDGEKTVEEIKNGHIPYGNGEWKEEIPGIWVSKYEVSGTISKLKSLPNQTALTNLKFKDYYDSMFNYNRDAESHMIKNSEWGAVAYLAHSMIGRNETNITPNTAVNNTTGGSEIQTTTGNIYGIYDMSGGGQEHLAGYIPNGNNNLTLYGSDEIIKTKDLDAYKTESTEYLTVYPFNVNDSNRELNYNEYKNIANNNYGYGDAILETSTDSGENGINTAWFYVSSLYSSSSEPFFGRGGGATSAQEWQGIFAFNDLFGKHETCTSRMVLVP